MMMRNAERACCAAGGDIADEYNDAAECRRSAEISSGSPAM